MKQISKLLCAGMMSLTAHGLMAEEVVLDRVVAIVNNEVITENDMRVMLGSIEQTVASNQQELPDPAELKQQVTERLILDSLQMQMAQQLGIRVSDSQLDATISNVLREQNKTREQITAEYQQVGLSFADFREQVRTELITGELSRSQVRRRVSVSDQEVDALVELIDSQGRDTIRYRVGNIQVDTDTSDAQVQSILEQLRNGASFNQLALKYSIGPRAVDGGDWGWMTLNEMPTVFAEVVENQKKGSVIGPFRSGAGIHIVKVLDLEGAQTIAIQEVNIRHILVKPSIILSDEKAQRMLDGFRAEIIAGDKSFAELARNYSEDPGSAVRGGELGWANPNVFVPEFREMANSLPQNQLSEPFRSSFGWHILEVLGKRETENADDASRNQAYQMLFNRKFNEEMQTWLDELKDEAYIEILSDPS
ncbi:peptidylprolyl isomerase SurA [Alginatibacterium sediminis]|uniref:Chaperone SurA n=1 Tax=Alginatibacterium sediminis TaxID=2164068 RepID=A0A420E7T1_9ALTE|nr:peptidylprolyl isomerase SurA [Alginatibacterium sediminis]RKF14541.1 peptidylprolyl isomerase SurA [Alginatibacterium sediminis]